MTPRTSSLLLLLCGLVLFYGGEARGQIPVPIGPSSWEKNNGDTILMLAPPGGEPPVMNYQMDDGTWDYIVDEWEQVPSGKQIWTAVRGHRKLYVDSTGRAIYAIRDGAGAWHYLGTETTHAIKYKISDGSWQTLRAAAPDSIAVDGAKITLFNVFPGINKALWNTQKMLGLNTEAYQITQEGRDTIATYGPWGGRLFGIATRLYHDSLNLTWKQAGNAIDFVNGHLTDSAVGLYNGNEFAVRFPSARLFDATGAQSDIVVRKWLVQQAGDYYLIELFDPVAANALPPGEIYHNLLMGTGPGDEEANTSNLEDQISGMYGSPSSNGCLDSAAAYLLTVNGGTDSTYYWCWAVYDTTNKTGGYFTLFDSTLIHDTTVTGSWGPAWKYGSFVNAPDGYMLTTDVYFYCVWGDDMGTKDISLKFGAQGGWNIRWKTGVTFDRAGVAWPRNLYDGTFNYLSNYRYNVGVYYTAGACAAEGGEAIPPRRRLLMGAGQ